MYGVHVTASRVHEFRVKLFKRSNYTISVSSRSLWLCSSLNAVVFETFDVDGSGLLEEV